MIGNTFLKALYGYPDEDTSLNQLLELLRSKDQRFLDSLYKPLDVDASTDDERRFLTVVSALIDYHLQLYQMAIPDWLRNEKLCFDKPYYQTQRLSDFEKIKLQYTVPGPFKRRNVYIDMEGIKRI